MNKSIGIRNPFVNDSGEAEFPAPVRLPGRPDKVLTPLEFTALTGRSRDPVQLGDDFGLTEERVDTIDKNGFQIFGRKYMHAALTPYTSGDKSGPRPTLVARYDRALAARGILEEVKVLEVLDGGVYKPICLAVPREKFNSEAASRAEFFAFRREYLNVLLAKRKLAGKDILVLREQDRELKAFFDKQRARSRKKPKGQREVSAQPITLDDLREQPSPIGTAIQETDASSVHENHSAAPMPPKGSARPSTSFTHVEETATDGLGNALGGPIGFVADQDD